MNSMVLTRFKSVQTEPGKGQQGSVLLVSLIILLIMTLLGLSTMQTSQVEMRMATNFKERQEALQAAEQGLVAAQQFLEDMDFDDDVHIPRAASAGASATCSPISDCFRRKEKHPTKAALPPRNMLPMTTILTLGSDRLKNAMRSSQAITP